MMFASLLAARSSAASADDYSLSPFSIAYTAYTNVNSRVPVSAGLSGGEATAVIVAFGQSTIASHDNALYTPSNAKVENFNIYNGGVYQWQDPPLGATFGNVAIGPGSPGGSPLGRLADKIISNGWLDRVIVVPAAVAATSVQDWATGSMNHRIGVTAKRLASVGLLSSVSAVLWQQGETDKTFGTSQGDYSSRLATVIATARTSGFTAPIFVAQSTRQNDGTTSAAVRAACVAAVDHGNGIYAGPDCDSLDASNRYDNQHWNATGSNALADLWVTALGNYGAPFS